MASVSKNQRKASGTKAPVQVGNVTRLIIPCNHGKHAYVTDIKTGKNPHLATSSDEFEVSIAANVTAGQTNKLLEEFNSLASKYPNDGWDKLLDRLVEKEVIVLP